MPPSRRGFAFVVASAVSFGGAAVLGKLLFADGMSVAPMQAWRWAVAALALAPLALRRWSLGRRAALAAFGIGFVGQGLTSGLYFASLRTLPAAVGSFLLYLFPVIVAALSALLLDEALTRRGLAALGLAVGGLGLLAWGQLSGVGLAGVALAGAAAFCYAGVVVGMRALAPANAVQGAWCLMAGAALAFALAALAEGSLALPPSAAAWRDTLLLGVVSTAFSVAMLYKGLPLVGAPRAALVSTLEPISTIGVAGAVLGEWFSPLQAAGAGLVLAAVVLLGTEERGEEPAGRADARPTDAG